MSGLGRLDELNGPKVQHQIRTIKKFNKSNEVDQK